MISQHQYPSIEELGLAGQKDVPKHGSPPNSNLEFGPVQNRGCTDLLFCLVFITSVIAMAIIAIIGFKEGQPLRLTYPYDPDDRACGYDTAVEDFPYIYLVTPLPDFFNRTTCLKNCPNYQANNKPQFLNCSTNKLVTSCKENYIPGSQNMQQGTISYSTLLNDSVFIYNTTEVFGRFCMPTQDSLRTMMTSQLDLSFIQEWVSDLQMSWPVLLGSVFVAYLIGFIYMGLMRYLSGVMVWFTILLYFVLVIFLGYFCFEKQKKQQELADQSTIAEEKDEYQQQQQILFGMAISLWVIAGISFLLFLCNFNKIRLSIAIIKSAAVFTKDVPATLLVPIFMGLIMIGFWVFWVAQFIYVFSIGDITGNDSTPFATIKWNQKIRYMLIYQIFEGLWCSTLINAITEFILANSCIFWYFSQNGGTPLSFPVLTSIKRAFLYHLGSLALGSFLLATIKFIRLWLEYIQKNIPADSKNSQPMKCFIDCLKCYVSCFERFIEFLNKCAYIQIALTGKSFCMAAKDGIYLMKNNMDKQFIVVGIGHLFSDIGKYFIALSTTLIGYSVVAYHGYFAGKLFSPIFPTVFVFLISIFIGHLFMVVYCMGIETILHCYLVDKQLQNKKGKQPKHCPQPLKEYMNYRSNNN